MGAGLKPSGERATAKLPKDYFDVACWMGFLGWLVGWLDKKQAVRLTLE